VRSEIDATLIMQFLAWRGQNNVDHHRITRCQAHACLWNPFNTTRCLCLRRELN